MDAPNRNTLWANIFVDELARAGLRAAVIAPGSRSTPLTVAFARHPDITVYSLLDERGAAFFALGLALSGGQAAALVCTSGTATANFYPAVIEADAAHVPLLLLTTDRPPELRHSGANQTVDQIKLYGDHVRWFVDVALPEADPPAVALRALRTLAGRALAATTGSPPGPVHLNFPFRKPLEPTPVPNDNTAPADDTPRPDDAPFVRVSRGTLQPSTEQVVAVSAALRRARRGLIVCGPRCPGGDFPAAVVQLAQESGFSIFADALSGVRFGPHTTGASIIAGYETFLQPDVVSGWEAPEIILQFGAVPISNWLMAYLSGSSNAQRFQISGTGVWQDDSHRTGHFIWAEPAALCRAVAGQLAQNPPPPRDETWLTQLQRAETETWQTIETAQAAAFFEGTILSDVVELMPSPGQLFVASSLPVRHLDQFARPTARNLRVFANRGASGIDGTIAAAAGAAAADNRPLALVIGDLAFYHDLNSLLALKRCGLPITVVLINNNGGGIFRRLPIAQFDPPITELFVTPHGLQFEPVARMFGASYTRPANRAEFRRAFRLAVGADTPHIIEIMTDSAAHEQTRRELCGKVVEILAPPAGVFPESD